MTEDERGPFPLQIIDLTLPTAEAGGFSLR